jgi:hypothetical protein
MLESSDWYFLFVSLNRKESSGERMTIFILSFHKVMGVGD